MIDIHTHILPNIDDGAASVEEMLLMANIAVGEGIHTLIATPHHANGRYDNPGSQVIDYIPRIQSLLNEHKVPLTVLPGQEIRIHKRLIDHFMEKDVIALNSSRFILIELPAKEIPSYTDEIFHELLVMGMTPVIAHPERNAEFASNPGRLVSFIRQGALAQVTSHSVNGKFGSKIQKLTMDLCKHHLVHFISSDAHNSTVRSFGLKEAYQRITSKLGQDRTLFYQNNAYKLLKNETIHVQDPTYRPRKWFFLI